MTESLARLIRGTSSFGSLVWISPGNPSSQRWFEALPSARKHWVPWGPDQPMPAHALPRGEERTLFLWNPVVHGASSSALRALFLEMRPGDRLGFLLPEPARSSDLWRYELKEAGFEVLRTLVLGKSPFVPGTKLSLHFLRAAKPWLSKPSLSLVVPVRNEAGKIPTLLSRLTGLDRVETEILFVEGHSSDDTWGAIGRSFENYKGPFRLRTLRQPGRGKSDAVQWGLGRAEGKVLGVLDGNLSTPPETFRRFYEALVEGRGDLIYGDRFRLPVDPGAMALATRLGYQLMAGAMGRLVRQPVGDVLCGTRVISASDYKGLARWAEKASRLPLADFDWMIGASALDLKLFGIPVLHKGASAFRADPFRELVRLASVWLRSHSFKALRD